jgi:hypothetical protein
LNVLMYTTARIELSIPGTLRNRVDYFAAALPRPAKPVGALLAAPDRQQPA